MVFIIISGIFIIIAIVFYIKSIKNINTANLIKIEKKEEQNLLNKEIENINKQIDILINSKAQLQIDIINEKENLKELQTNEKNNLLHQLAIYEENINRQKKDKESNFNLWYQQKQTEYDEAIIELNNQKEEYQNEIDKLRETLRAADEANLREREKEENLDFYKLQLTSIELEDIKQLESIKKTLHNPVILSKLIWTQYFQKQTTELCNRILGKDTICGIYKITNILTKQCYIGQSVDVANRWKQHTKCGLGIEASATNKLYSAMQKFGIWNFTYELIEKCPKEQLDEKEKQWIDLYDSAKNGYNSTKGNG